MRIQFYLVALAVSTTTFSLSIAALLQPNWIRFQTPKSSPISLTTNYGLFQRCDSNSFSGDGVTCRKFPVAEDCGRSGKGRALRALNGGHGKGDDEDGELWGFCESWITAGYATYLSIPFGAAAILASLLFALSGRHKRESSWPVVAGLISSHALLLIVAMALVVHEFNSSERFFYGARLDTSLVMATTAWSLDVATVGALVLVGALGLAREDGYQAIGDSVTP